MREPKSITEQTPWPCRVLNFGKAQSNQVEYFNPSIVRTKDGLHLITRRSIMHQGQPYGFNDLFVFKLGEDWVPLFGFKLRSPQEAAQEHQEDPRAFVRGDRIWVSSCNFILQVETRFWTGAHQALFSFTEDWTPINRYDPRYAGNGGNVYQVTRNEKNWLWFFYNDEPHMIYLSEPFRVVRFANPNWPVGEWETPGPKWKWGDIRGGTPPVLVDDLWWSFYHSSNPAPEPVTRRYYMGAYAFENKPPFRVVRCTKKPLLTGSRNDPWAPKKKAVVFPCGAIYEKDSWLVSLGVNDMASAMIQIPHKDLARLCKPMG